MGFMCSRIFTKIQYASIYFKSKIINECVNITPHYIVYIHIVHSLINHSKTFIDI